VIRIERNPSRRQLRVFGLSLLAFCGLVGGVWWWKTGSLAEAGVFWAIGAAAPALGEIWPRGLRLAYLAASYATFPIGWGVSHLILAVVYYLLLFPIGLVLRLRGYDPMQRRFDQNAKSYWTHREREEGTERYFRQF
jgi:hypothetical protein